MGQEGWISVAEKLPEKHDWYLTFDRNESICMYFYGKSQSGRIGFTEIDAALVDVTHWMPLPAPPGKDSAPSSERDRFDDFADEIEQRIKMFSPNPANPNDLRMGFRKKHLAFAARQWFGSVAEQPQPAKKPPYTAFDKAVRIVLGAQPKFVVIEPEAHCSLITEDTLLIWAEQPSREQATSSGSGILEPHKTSLAVTEGQGEPNGAALPDSPREQAVEGLVEALRKLYPHIHDSAMEGESEFERAWMAVEAALAHYEASRGERQ